MILLLFDEFLPSSNSVFELFDRASLAQTLIVDDRRRSLTDILLIPPRSFERFAVDLIVRERNINELTTENPLSVNTHNDVVLVDVSGKASTAINFAIQKFPVVHFAERNDGAVDARVSALTPPQSFQNENVDGVTAVAWRVYILRAPLSRRAAPPTILSASQWRRTLATNAKFGD